MTRTEQAELQELGMSPEELKQRQAQVAALTALDKPAKKTRSDKGKSRKVVQPVPQAGALTVAQRDELLELIQDRDTKRVELDTAQDQVAWAQGRFDEADAAVIAHINALTAK